MIDLPLDDFGRQIGRKTDIANGRKIFVFLPINSESIYFFFRKKGEI
jgi:hypothetical protein